MFKRIVKRDGKIVKFDPEKIIEAISKAGGSFKKVAVLKRPEKKAE